MRPILFALAGITLCLIIPLALLGIGTVTQATVPLDTTLDVCPPPISTPIAKIPATPTDKPTVPDKAVLPESSAAQPTHTTPEPQRLSVAGDLAAYLGNPVDQAMPPDNVVAAVGFHFERRCGPNGCQLVRVPNSPAVVQAYPPTAPQACMMATTMPQACQPAATMPGACDQADASQGDTQAGGPVRRLLAAIRPRSIAARMQARRGG
jgi:hypothetical protein